MGEEETTPATDQGLDPIPPSEPMAGSPWRDLPPPARSFAQRDLMNWVKYVFRRDYPEPAEAVKDCWPMHADVVGTYRALKARLDAAYFPHAKDGEIGAAPIYRLTDWDSDLERAHDRWVLSFKRCDGTVANCHRAKPPSYSELSEPQAAAETDQAAEGAWGAVPPDLPPPMEPWEVAQGIAERQATSAEEADGNATGSPEVSGVAESW